ncbi:class I SAM-dependent methyltransferase [Actinoplanes sp. NPDC051633]|uniref:class I SAM-dependent methyltransferase n=1 Tax=Actinoplanes sp. NPDC051633 TaxID=3155670 RepID=UPI0034138B4B
MTDTQHIDEAKAEAFVGQLITDLAGAAATAMTVVGDRLGLYRAMTGAGPVTAEKLAATTGLHPRLVGEWLNAQAVSGYVTVDGDTFELPIEHALALSVVDSPAYIVGGAEIVAGHFLNLGRLEHAFRGDGGIAYADMPHSVHHGIERFFRTAYVNQLAQAWFPAVPGLVEKLTAGARVADVGCGHGFAARLIARTWPAATVVGFDNHAPSIATARARVIEEPDLTNVTFQVADAADLGDGTFDVICFFDALHDLGDPEAALRAAFDRLAPGGIVVAVEPWSTDNPAEAIGNPIVRLGYAGSTALCTPTSLSQPGAYGMGTCGGPSQRVTLLTAAGFENAGVAADTGHNLVVAGTKPAR